MTIGSVSASTVSTLLGARNSQAVRQAYDTAATSTPATSGDKVSISEAGRSASRAEQSTGRNDFDKLPDGLTGPSWMADYFFIHSLTLDTKYTDDPTYGTDPSARAEYWELVEGHSEQLLKDYGDNDPKAYLERLMNDKEFSETVRLEMLNRVKNDARLVELLPKVGKSFLLD